MSKKTKLTDKEKEIIKKVTDYIQYVPDEQKIYILGVVDTVGMLCRDEKAGQEMRRIKKLLPILLSALLCYLFKVTGKLEGSFEYSQTYMLLYLCIKNVLEEY